MHVPNIWVKAILVHSLSFSAIAQTPPAQRSTSPPWQLVWADEFEVSGPPSPETWEFETGFVRNHELQWYQSANASCKDGVLIIEGRREKVENPAFQPDHPSWIKARPHSDYTSSSIITHERLAWTFGRFEIRARFAALPGLWPAIWTTGLGTWPRFGEIDIMEFYNEQILANSVHAGKAGSALWNSSKTPITEFDPASWNQNFHLWVMEWNREEITIHLDGRLLNRIDLSATENLDGSAFNPFHKPQRLRLNLAIGALGGDPSNTIFPQKFEIDYVRIYQQ